MAASISGQHAHFADTSKVTLQNINDFLRTIKDYLTDKNPNTQMKITSHGVAYVKPCENGGEQLFFFDIGALPWNDNKQLDIEHGTFVAPASVRIIYLTHGGAPNWPMNEAACMYRAFKHYWPGSVCTEFAKEDHQKFFDEHGFE